MNGYERYMAVVRGEEADALGANIFAYLGDSKQWQKVVITRRPGRQPAKIEPNSRRPG